MADLTVSNDIDTFMQSADKAAARTALGATATGQAAITAADAAALRDAAGATAGVLPGSTVAAATESAAGVGELATPTETVIGGDTSRIVTPEGLMSALARINMVDLHWSPEGWSHTTANGGAAPDYFVNGVELDSGSTAGGSVFVKNDGAGSISAALTYNNVNRAVRFDRPGRLALNIVQENASATGRLTLRYPESWTATDLSRSGAQGWVGIECDGLDLYGIVGDGTDLTLVDLGASFANLTPRRITVEWDGAGNVDWWVTDAFGAPPSLLGSTASGPTGLGSGSRVAIKLDNQGTTDRTRWQIGPIRLIQNYE